MKAKIKEMFKDEEKALDKMLAEINRSDDMGKTAKIPEEALKLVNQMLIDLENIKEHPEFNEYKNALLGRRGCRSFDKTYD